MQRLENFINAIKAFALFVGLYAEKFLEDHLFQTNMPNTTKPAFVTVLTFLGLIALIRLGGAIAEFAIERWRGLRKTVLGDSYIEGIWFNKVPLDSPLYGLLRIEIRDGTVRVNGEQYDPKGALTASWHSEMARFDGSVLTYSYKVTYSRHKEARETDGVSSISFAKASYSGVPISYNGHFHDALGNTQSCCFTGFRVAKQLSEQLEAAAERLQAVKTLIADADKLPSPPRAT